MGMVPTGEELTWAQNRTVMISGDQIEPTTIAWIQSLPHQTIVNSSDSGRLLARNLSNV